MKTTSHGLGHRTGEKGRIHQKVGYTRKGGEEVR